MTFNLNRHHILALLVSTSIMILALGGVFIGEWLSDQYQPKVEVRKISPAFTPPPPKPPQPVEQQVAEVLPNIELNPNTSGVSLRVEVLDIEQPIDDLLSPPTNIQHNPADFDASLDVDWQAFGLGELDAIPSLLTQISINFPKALVRKGIKTAEVHLEVFIDEQGKVSLINIVEMPYEELHGAVKQLIRKSRFSIPTKDGQPVRARFVWPMEFSAS